jgi:TolB-like protein/Tfp pilus assembly protein PilF
MKQIWQDSFVEEHNLAVSISLLRIALEDDRRQPKYIETVARRGYRFVAAVKAISNGNVEKSAAATTTELLPASQSIAVFPFKNLSAQERNQYLGLGLADALITRLSNLKQVTVRPASAVLKFAGKATVNAGRQLKVDSILDGTIQKCGRQIRVTAQHVRVSDGMILWAAKFDEEFTNLFAVEDSISEQVATALSGGSTNGHNGPLTKRYTENIDAYHAYLKGRYFLNKRSAEGFDKGIKYFSLAIEIDPNYALAYAGLADCYNLLGSYMMRPPKEATRKARAAALKALKLDYCLAEAHIVMGHIKLRCDWDWVGAEEEFKLAIEMNRNCPSAHQLYSLFLRTTGRLEESMREIKQAQELDPLSLVINASMSGLLYLARQYDAAIEQLKSIIEMDGNFSTANVLLGLAYTQKGLHDEAIAEFQRAIEMYGDHSEVRAFLAYAFASSGQSAKAREVLDRLQELNKRQHVSPYIFALIHTALGEIDEAFACLERGFEEQDEELGMLKMDPLLDRLHEDSRFKNLLQRIGLTPQVGPPDSPPAILS